MQDDWKYQEAISFLLWGKKGYSDSQERSSSEFSIEKILNFLKHKKESVNGDDI